jgi:altronate dehydratase
LDAVRRESLNLMETTPLQLTDVGRRPAPSDNAAIATRRLEPGTIVLLDGAARTLRHTVLEGHRFAVRPIAPGEEILSWGLPFGTATTRIAPGDYLVNESVLAALKVRAVNATLPATPNFADRLEPFQLHEPAFQAAPPVPRAPIPRTFVGYRRTGRRGTGTRNCIVILGTSSRTAAFARQLAVRLQPLGRLHPALDGIVAIGHTEGGGNTEPNNASEVLRVLAGFIVHPNVGAVLAVDEGSEPVNNTRLRVFMAHLDYPLADVPHEFLSLRDGVPAALAAGEAIVRRWLPGVSAARRTEEPLSGLRLALQCGGSDAFSGVSGNPLVGAVAHELIRHGGSANLCETDEAFGGEAHLLANVRDLATARSFLRTLDGFRERLRWHGETAESNPSGGNKLRGLYNISLKSLGAVQKKSPLTRLDTVIDYAEPMGEPGFYFMNSPGNDLEGIAGQIAAGCNAIMFVTGNGSITNFPFVPTIKVTTTTRRHQLLIHEMDINAGRYVDGEPMPDLAAESFELLCATAAGRRTLGERAGHSQVSLWRDWRQTDTSLLAALRARPAPDGRPLPLAASAVATANRAEKLSFRTWRLEESWATEPIGLILPTSMCSSQVARMAAARLTETRVGCANGIQRFVALPHTEGCGFGGESMQQLLQRTYRGYALHPNVAAAVFLEHGCEKVPNDVMRHELLTAGVAPERFGWVSVQLDGGIAKAMTKIEGWFTARFASLPPLAETNADLGRLCVGLLTATTVEAETAGALAALTRAVIALGGSVLVPEDDPLLRDPTFRAHTLGPEVPWHATLAYGQPLSGSGLHVVATETDHWVENLTGLGGCGVHVFLTFPGSKVQPKHPFIPVCHFGEGHEPTHSLEIDALLHGSTGEREKVLFRQLSAALDCPGQPSPSGIDLADFQLTRGLLGVSA